MNDPDHEAKIEELITNIREFYPNQKELEFLKFRFHYIENQRKRAELSKAKRELIEGKSAT